MRLKVLVLLTVVLGLARADWECVGPFGGTVYSGAISPSNPQIVYLSPHSYPTPLLKSTDGGENWTQTGQLGYFASRIAVHPNDPNTVMAAASALYKTTNGGSSWTYQSVPGGNYAQAVAYNPVDPQQIVAAGYGYAGYNHYGIYRTTNGGAVWDTIGLDTMHYSIGYSVCYDPVDPNIIYTGGYNGQPTIVYKSTDAGLSWTKIPTGFNGYYCYALHVSSLDHNTVLACSYYQGILRSTDQGETWTRVATYSPVYAFAEVPDDAATIYAGADNALYVSRDTGRTWTPITNRPAGIWGRTLMTTSDCVYFGNKAGFFRSTDQGATWESLIADYPFAKVQTIALDATAPEGVWIEYKDDGVYKSADNGSSWTRCPDFLSCGNICGIVTDPRNPLKVWALEGSG